MAKRLNIEDYRGKKYGKLTILDFYIKNHSKYAICKCDCGTEKLILLNNLKRGKVKSCGCLQKELVSKKFKRHGMTNTRIFRIWCKIKERCFNKNHKYYKNYGARGITICEKWLDNFINFYNWAILNGYQDNLTIDRIDVNGNYEPNNCRWVTKQIQAINKRVKNKYGANGISWSKTKNKYQVDIGYKGKIIRIGYFKDLKEAIKARQKAEKLYFEPLLSMN